MTGSQYFALAALIYIAPHLSNRSGWALAAVCVILSVICKIGEAA